MSFHCESSGSCSFHGDCFNQTLCRCNQGFYYDDCSTTALKQQPEAWLFYRAIFFVLYGLAAAIAAYRTFLWYQYIRQHKEKKFFTVVFIHVTFVIFLLARSVIFYAIDPYGMEDIMPSFLQYFAQELDRPSLGAGFVFLFLYWLELYNTILPVRFIKIFRISAFVIWGVMFIMDIAAAINLSLQTPDRNLAQGFSLWYSVILVIVLQLGLVIYGCVIFYTLWKQKSDMTEYNEHIFMFDSLKKRAILLLVLAILNIIGALAAVSENSGEEGVPDNSSDGSSSFFGFSALYAVLSLIFTAILLAGFLEPPEKKEVFDEESLSSIDPSIVR